MSDPTSPNFSTLIAKFLRTVVELNKDLESTKINLVENHLFNPFVAYQYFDRFGQGYATKADIRAFFAKYSLPVSETQLDYLIYSEGRLREPSLVISRNDCMYYENFLNMLRPANARKLTDNLTAHQDFYAGKAHVLQSYVFEQFVDCIKKILKTYEAIQLLRIEMINLYGYLAAPAFKLVTGNGETVNYYQLKSFMEKEGNQLSQEEFDLLCSIYEFSHDRLLTKTEFLNIFTPFDKAVYYNVGDRRYDMLASKDNQNSLEEYMANLYNYKPATQSHHYEDPRLKEVAVRMNQIFSNHNKADEFAKKNLMVSQEGKIIYDLKKKSFPYNSISGFKEHFDPYHKVLYKQEKEETYDLLMNSQFRVQERPKEAFVRANPIQVNSTSYFPLEAAPLSKEQMHEPHFSLLSQFMKISS